MAAPSSWSRPSAASVVLLSLGLLNIGLGLAARWQAGEFGDFAVLHESAGNWWTGAPLYARANLNPPLVVLAMSPLGLIPVRSAWIVWQVVNAAAFVWTVRLTLGATGQRATPLVVAILALHASTAAQTALGQIAWVLGLPLAYAWLAWRGRRFRPAGIWLGVALAAKPFLLPLLVVMSFGNGWRAAISGVLTAVALTIAAAVVSGFGALLAFVALSDQAWGSVGGFPLGSLSGMLHRWGVPDRVSLAVAALLFVPTVWRWRALDQDRRWLAALSATLLFNPLGWVYYQAWLVPAGLAVWRRADKRLLAPGIVLGCLPPVVAAAVPSVQPLYLVSLLLIWAASLARVAAENPDGQAAVLRKPARHSSVLQRSSPAERPGSE